MNEYLNNLPSFYDILNYIYNNNINDIIDYFNNLLNSLNDKENNNLKYNIKEIIKLCNDIRYNEELDYKILLINAFNYIINDYFKTYSCYNEYMPLNITNDILINYKNQIYTIKNDNKEIENIDININIINYHKNIIKITFMKGLKIENLNINIINNYNKNISIQLNGNFNNKNEGKENKQKIKIKNLNINGNFTTLFMNTITYNYKIQELNIYNNNLLQLLNLNHSLKNNSQINLKNINRFNKFKIILTNYKLKDYIININNEPFILTNYKYKCLNNKFDFYL